jgi:phage-related protein
MMDVLTYGGKSFAEFNTFFDASKSFGTPEKEYEIISIPGRNGDLSVFNNKYKDQTIDFPCFIRSDFLNNFRSLTEYLNSLNGYQRLESSKEPNHFRKALFLGLVDPRTTPFNHGGFFTISFRCNPQRWLKQGENWQTFDNTATQQSPAAIFNPTLQTTKPIIRVYGSGTVSVNGSTFNIASHTYEYAEVDCENCDVYYKGSSLVNLNNKFSGYFPELKAGENQIFLIGATKIEIQPRWFEI